jgi:hypothetical protein
MNLTMCFPQGLGVNTNETKMHYYANRSFQTSEYYHQEKRTLIAPHGLPARIVAM